MSDFVPTVKCCDCGGSFEMLPDYSGGSAFKLPEGFVIVAPMVSIVGQLRDPEASNYINEAMKKKIQTIYFCPDCSTAERHLQLKPLNAGQPQARKIAVDEPQEAAPEVQAEAPISERREKKRPSMLRSY